MPASYRIDVRAGVVFSMFEDHVTNEELLDHQHRLSADPDFRPTMNQVIDARGVTETSVTAFGVRLVATPQHLRSGIASRDHRARRLLLRPHVPDPTQRPGTPAPLARLLDRHRVARGRAASPNGGDPQLTQVAVVSGVCSQGRSGPGFGVVRECQGRSRQNSCSPSSSDRGARGRRCSLSGARRAALHTFSRSTGPMRRERVP